MSTIQSQLSMFHIDSGLNVSASAQRTTVESSFSSDAITVTTTPEAVSLGDITVARQVVMKLVSGDDLLVGLDYGTDGITYPFRLSGAGDSMFVSLDVAGLDREITTFTAKAENDTGGTLEGDYLILREYADAIVWVWFDLGTRGTGTLTSNNTNFGADDQITIGSKTYTFKVSLTPTEGEVLIGADADATLLNLIRAINHTGTPDTHYKCAVANTQVSAAASVTAHAFLLTAIDPGVAGNYTVSFPVGATLSGGTLTGGAASGGTAPTVTTQRLISVTVPRSATAIQVAVATAAALDADSEFSCPVPTTAVFVVTATSAGTRTLATVGATGWTAIASATQEGAASPTVYLKSAGTSQVVVAVAPN
jgi:hypothetical protein